MVALKLMRDASLMHSDDVWILPLNSLYRWLDNLRYKAFASNIQTSSRSVSVADLGLIPASNC
jgi:hypothetical protein